MTIPKVLLAVLAASALALAFDGQSFTEKFNRLPQAVKNTATAHMENAFPVSISSSQGEHGWNYQVNTRLDGKYHDLVIDQNGKLLAVKDETDLASLPAAAKAALEKQGVSQGSSSNVVTLEKVTEGEQISYGAVIKSDAQGGYVQVRVAADGSLRSKTETGTGR